jgi:hypothetical protein
MEEEMFDAGRRPMGRLFYWAMTAMVAVSGFWLSVSGPAWAQVATTTVSDTVYLADGSAASGILIITWPAFVTASGTAVAPGNTNVTLGTNGALSVALVPNAGATPAGSYYTVVYQLGPAVAAREIIFPDQFKNGISQIVDGVVMCMNSSAWAKKSGSEPGGPVLAGQ